MLSGVRFTAICLLVLRAANAARGGSDDVAGNNTWIKVHTNDNVQPGGQYRNRTNALNLFVYASRFNYTKAMQAIKVEFRGNLDTPTPSPEQPLVISVRNVAGGHTFTVPYVIYDRDGSPLATEDHATRFLCPGEIGSTEYAIATVGTGYRNPHNPADSYLFQVQFEVVGHWTLNLGAPEKLVADPTDPAVFSFSWPEAGGLDHVLVSVDSVSAPGICATVALQERICPLALTPAEVSVGARFFTVTRAGALVVRRALYPDGFFVIALPGVNDVACDPAAPAVANATRKKTVKVTVTAHASRMAYVAVPAVLALLLLAAGFGVTRLVRHNVRRPRLEFAASPTPRERSASLSSLGLAQDDDLDPETATEPAPDAQPDKAAGLSPLSLLAGGALLLLALGGDAVLAGLRGERDSGDHDLCYRNELCSHAVGALRGANHVIARVPYVGAGFGLLLAARAQRAVYRAVTLDGVVHVGVAHDFDLVDGVGLALVLQGLLSGLYAACPSPRAGHLDVAFVYFAVVALGCKLFQTRRGLTAVGHYTPLVATAALLLADTAKRLAGNAWYVWLVVAVAHVAVAFAVAAQLYVFGTLTACPGSPALLWQRAYLAVESPNYRMNRATFATALAANVALAVAGAASQFSDFNYYVMIVLEVHVVFYLTYYLLMKQVKAAEETGRPSLAMLTGGALLLLAAVVVLCGYATFSTELSPASSRLLNRACLGPSVLDVHDVWHQLAAVALFLLSAGLLLLDDDLLPTPRHDILRF